MRTKLVAGNWKMHGSLAENEALLRTLLESREASGAVRWVVCVPFPYLAQVQSLLSGSAVAWGAQNASEHAKGAFTGEVSVAMLGEFGCRYVIVGHSERRVLYREGDAQVAAKFKAVKDGGLTPILCVGESLAQREAGRTNEVVGEQLRAVLESAGNDALADAVLAYEPVWAIGTGRSASPGQAQEVHGWLREQVARAAGEDAAARLPILYGGSVKAANAAELFAQPDIDGGLIGGASLIVDDFLAICRAADQ
ncbi:MAG: triose-phosphate isomerase [Burkholderiales bacterium]|nr:triose-phosphate isomerase [Burkholderiales bacterium]